MKDFVDFAIILEKTGGVKVFTNYDFRMKKSAQVHSLVDLILVESVRALVLRKLGLSVPIADAHMEDVGAANEVDRHSAVNFPPTKAQATKIVDDKKFAKRQLLEMIKKMLKQSLQQVRLGHI